MKGFVLLSMAKGKGTSLRVTTWCSVAFGQVNGFEPKSLAFLSEKQCVFSAGKLIVEMDIETKKQRRETEMPF